MEILTNYFIPIFWLVLAVVLIVIEVLSFNLITIWFAISALVMVFVSFIDISFTNQFLIFLAFSIILLLVTRKMVQSKLNTRKIRTNADQIIGSKVLVTKKIAELNPGLVKTTQGIWGAKSNDTLLVNDYCIVKEIKGSYAIVEKEKK